MTENYLVEEARITPLPEERIVDILGEAGKKALYLTNFRLVYSGWERWFRILPVAGEQVRQIALLDDVDYVRTVIKRLPIAIAIVGALVAAFGFWAISFGSPEEQVTFGDQTFSVVKSDEPEHTIEEIPDVVAGLIGLGGLALIGAWFFIWQRLLRFTVSGAEHLEYELFHTEGPSRRADGFINEFFDQKFTALRRVETAAARLAAKNRPEPPSAEAAPVPSPIPPPEDTTPSTVPTPEPQPESRSEFS